jgi:ABC-2 type transport system permease protein
VRAATALDPMKLHELIRQPYDSAELLLMATLLIVAVYYSLDALHGERRDRSILFWKSLPVSDLITVLAKASIPVLILPLATFGIIVVTQSIIVVLDAAALLASGLGVATLWRNLSLFQMWSSLFAHIVGFHGLWYAPFYCWMLLASAWARRAPLLWATLPPLAIGIIEKITFNTSFFGSLLLYRFSGGPETGFAGSGRPTDSLTHLHAGQFLTSPGMWSGLVISAIFLAAAERLRRYREPI